MHVTANGVRLYFDVDGSGLAANGAALNPRPTILALHGGPGFDHAYLRSGLAPLSRWAQIVYLDQRGQGRSQSVALEDCTIERMAADTAAFCHAIGLEKPIVIGHSLGGYVALTLALDRPDLVGGLVLANTAPHIDLEPALTELERRFGAEVAGVARSVFGGDISDEVVAAYQSLVLPTYTHPSAAHALAELGYCRLNLAFAEYFFRHHRHDFDVRARLAAITQPTLVVTGSDDWIAPPSVARELAARIPGAECGVMARTGHFSFGERPRMFANLVTRFRHRHGLG